MGRARLTIEDKPDGTIGFRFEFKPAISGETTSPAQIRMLQVMQFIKAMKGGSDEDDEDYFTDDN